MKWKSLSHILLLVFCLRFPRIHHDYFFRRVFESVRAQFLSGNISGLLVIYMLNYDSSKIRVPKVPFHIFYKLKYEIRKKVLIFVFILKLEHKTNQTKWFFDFQINWELKFKFEVRFSFFILIWRTKKQIYLNEYLMKLVTIPLTQSQ